MAAPILPRCDQVVERERKLTRILVEVEEAGGVDAKQLLRRRADGHDPARLRGLPAIGRNARARSEGRIQRGP
jgi:hypothetical protein